ncbi:ABC transporter ATP-binding protein [Deltaproteobacteria bacterium OttesenSCG-928-K17]|nr:ABC transporter ATP-binding protein [Deltaproteobacteria bacterium OttesenSCG-928-K17]
MTRASFEKVAKIFGGRTVFSDMSFELKSGGRYGLLGPNGAGKSTLVRLLGGVLRPDKGRVLVDGVEPWKNQAKTRRAMGILPEGAPLISELTVGEHLALAGRLRALGKAEFKREEERLTEALGLAAFHHRPAGILSQGQKRRAALAAALLGSPDFLALDEPTSGLDPEEAVRLTTLLKNLPEQTTLLLSSHILTEIFNLTENVVVVAAGRLASFGPWKNMKEKPTEDDLRREYLLLTGAGQGDEHGDLSRAAGQGHDAPGTFSGGDEL